jgi:methanogenic corrinoid protein MtbC1
MYTIKRAAELTGLSVATLRAWERRYGIVSPQRTESGYRLYDAAAVRALTVMYALVQEGWTPKLAAAEARRRLGTEGRDDADADTGAGRGEPAPGRPAPVVATGLRREKASGGPVNAELEALVDAVSRLDAAALADLLDDAFSRGSFESVVDGWLMPALRALGDAWARGRVSVAGEHVASYAVQRRLAAAYEAAAQRTDGPRVIVGLPPGARHELGLLAFATAARRVGLSTVYVGADLPAEDWASAVTANRAVCVVLSVPCARDLPPLRRVVTDLRAGHPALTIAVGGREQAKVPEGCIQLGHDIGGAARLLAERLRVSGR